MKKVEIYTLSYCPYCQKAKMFLKSKGVDYIEYNSDDDEEKIREELTKRFNLPSLATFPQIIIDGVNIGGYSDMMAKYDNGEIVFE